MSDETTPHRKDGMSGTVKTILATISAGLITWAGSTVWKGFERIESNQAELLDRIGQLESDRARWATLAEMDRKMREYEAQSRIMMWLLEHGKIAEVTKPGDKPLQLPKPEWLDPEEYRKIMEQRYPNEPAPKKK